MQKIDSCKRGGYGRTERKEVKRLVKEHICMTYRHGNAVGIDSENVGWAVWRGQKEKKWDNCNSINNKTSKRKKIYNI